jgi:hypothetical protein
LTSNRNQQTGERAASDVLLRRDETDFRCFTNPSTLRFASAALWQDQGKVGRCDSDCIDGPSSYRRLQ